MTIIVFIAVLFVLVMVHEAGHFFAARKFGVKVFEFGFGIPPRVFGWRRKIADQRRLNADSRGSYEFVRGNQELAPSEKTLFSLNWLPIGGFVKIKGENEEIPEPDSFSSKKAWKRIVILSAGVIGNILLAFFLFIPLFSITSETYVPDGVSLAGARVKNEQIKITNVTKGSPAERAGVREGDTLVSLNQNSFGEVGEVRTYILSHGEQEIAIELARKVGAQDLVPLRVSAKTEIIGGSEKPMLGIAMVRSVEMSYPFHLAVLKAGEATVVSFYQIAKGLVGVVANLVQGKGAGVDVSGPVGIATMTGQAARMGFLSLLQFMAILSLNLAFINIIPFPALDGGRILFILIEKFRGKKMRGNIEQVVNTVGFSLLLLLILFVSVKDVGQLGFVQKIIEGVKKVF